MLISKNMPQNINYIGINGISSLPWFEYVVIKLSNAYR